MKTAYKDPDFLKSMINLFEKLGINSDTEKDFTYGVTQDYKRDTAEILRFQKRKYEIIQRSKYAEERVKSREEQEVMDALLLMKKELFIYKNIIEKLNTQIDALNGLISAEKNPKKIKLLKKTLGQVSTTLQKERVKLQNTRKTALLLLKQRKILKALKKIQKKQKEEIKEETKRLKTSPISKMLLPGKWLDIYKKNVTNTVKKLEQGLKKTSERVAKIESVKITPTAKTLPQKMSPPQSTPPSSRTAIRSKQQVETAGKVLFKKIHIESARGVSAPSATPTSQRLKKVRKDKGSQFIRKKGN